MVLEGTEQLRTEPTWVREVEATGDVRIVDAGARWPATAADLGPLYGVQAVVWFVKFRNLLEHHGFDWQGFGGLRVLLDHDACQNWGWQGRNQLRGMWSQVFVRDQFDLLLTSSRTAVERFAQAGVAADWLPKSYDQERFGDLGLPRSGTAHFGALYPARIAMLAATRRAGLSVDHLRCGYADLNDALNRYQACVVCNMNGQVRRFLRKVAPRHPLAWFRPSPGIEVFFKNYEVAASGAVPVCDWVDDLTALGFVDGETMLSYRSFDELVGQLAALTPECSLRIGNAASALVRSRHTHQQRARDFWSVLDSRC